MQPISKLLANIECAPRSQVCPQHGEYLSRHLALGRFSRCPECQKLEQQKTAEQEAARAAAQKRQAYFHRVRDAAIPPRYTDCTFENYTTQTDNENDALTTGRDYVDNFKNNPKNRKNLIILGDVGTGKTFLACAIGNDLLKLGYTVLYCTAQKMTRKIRESRFAKSELTESQAIDIFATPDLLILDEIGVQNNNEDEQNIIFSVISERYENNLPMIIISNLKLHDDKLTGEIGFINAIGRRNFDRVRSGAQWCGFTGSSRRGVEL